MAQQGTITLYEGIGKESKKPYSALKLEVGKWTKLYFVDSQFEMDYIKKYLNQEPKEKSIFDDEDVEL